LFAEQGEILNLVLDMGIAVGGRMEQKIHEDTAPEWMWTDPLAASLACSVHIHIAGPKLWRHITGSLRTRVPTRSRTLVLSLLKCVALTAT
jgi:hypothetical protein